MTSKRWLHIAFELLLILIICAIIAYFNRYIYKGIIFTTKQSIWKAFQVGAVSQFIIYILRSLYEIRCYKNKISEIDIELKETIDILKRVIQFKG